MDGLNGKIAYINLNDSRIEIKDLNSKLVEDYIGGVALSAKLIYDLLSDEDFETLKRDPLSSVNPLIFATGPLTGTATPSSSRYSVTGISPLTGIWGEATSGGFFPIALKRCGYDAIVITGEASEPKMITIIDGEIRIQDANNIWTKNTHECLEILKKELNDEKIRVACIGKGGENLVKYACILNDEGRAAGRCGFGALMGKKKLKALVIRGREKIEYNDRDNLMKEGKRILGSVLNNFASHFISHHGTLSYTDMGMVIGDAPAKYFTSTEFHAENLTGMALMDQYPVLQYACAGCAIGCGKTTFTEIDGKEIKIDGPEYETTMTFGPMCGIEDFKPILEANHICNLEGIDTISGGVAISFLIYLVENKISIDNISKYLSDIKLEEIRWGNEKVVLKILNQIVNREGIGDLLADGVKIMAEKLGVDPDLAAHVKGLEIPMHDPRAFLGQALTYMTSPIGASHNKGDFFACVNHLGGVSSAFGKVKTGDRFVIDGKESSVADLQDIRNLFDSAVICNWTFLNLQSMARLLQASTGLSSLGNKRKLLVLGKRATNLKRLISCKLGCKREDDYLPRIVTKALESGGSAGVELNLEENLRAYYKYRSWDWETGCPTKEKLEELGI